MQKNNWLKNVLILFSVCSIIVIYIVYNQRVLFSTVTDGREERSIGNSNLTQLVSKAVATPTTTSSLVQFRFNQIYKYLIWGNVGGGSGSGSSVNFTTTTRSILYDVIRRHKIRSMLDAPCGSFVWMPLLLKNISDEFRSRGEKFRYHGVDVVESIISGSKIRWSSEPDWNFSVCDFSAQDLPDNYDLIFSRDALQHLSYEKIFYSLRAFSRVKGARYLLIGSYVESAKSNGNIKIGDYFSINLLAPPFNLNNYVRIYYEAKLNPADPLKSLILYDIPNYLSKIDFKRLKTDLIY